jgi:hypothetical protein
VHHPGDEVGQCATVRVVDLGGDALRGPYELVGAAPSGFAAGGGVAGRDRERAPEANGLGGLEREPKGAETEVEAPQRVAQGEAGGAAERRVDARQVSRR